jgi:AcrR family transcriptional regulator
MTSKKAFDVNDPTASSRRRGDINRAKAHIVDLGGRRPPRQARAQQTVAAIVTAAAELLVDRGYARVSTNAIAERAGVSVGSVYQYFEDKDAIYRRLVAEHRAQGHGMIEHAMTRMLDPQADLVGELLDLMRRMAQMHGQDPRLMHAMAGELGHLGGDGPEEADLLPRVEGLLRARPETRDGDVAVTARLLFVTVDSLSRWLNHLGLDEGDHARYLAGVEAMLRGLLAPRSAAGRVGSRGAGMLRHGRKPA